MDKKERSRMRINRCIENEPVFEVMKNLVGTECDECSKVGRVFGGNILQKCNTQGKRAHIIKENLILCEYCIEQEYGLKMNPLF